MNTACILTLGVFLYSPVTSQDLRFEVSYEHYEVISKVFGRSGVDFAAAGAQGMSMSVKSGGINLVHALEVLNSQFGIHFKREGDFYVVQDDSQVFSVSLDSPVTFGQLMHKLDSASPLAAGLRNGVKPKLRAGDLLSNLSYRMVPRFSAEDTLMQELSGSIVVHEKQGVPWTLYFWWPDERRLFRLKSTVPARRHSVVVPQHAPPVPGWKTTSLESSFDHD